MGRWYNQIDSKPKYYFGMFVVLISIGMAGYATFWFNFDMQGLFVAFVVFLIGIFIVKKSLSRIYDPHTPPDI